MKQVSAARNCVSCARMLRAVSAALRGMTSGPSNTKLPKTTIANVKRPLQPAIFAAVRCELFATANPSFGGSILLFVMLVRGDDDFSAGVAFFQITDRSFRLANLVGAIDHRRNFSLLHE